MTSEGSSPEFDGQCALALSLGKTGVGGDPNCYLVEDGRRYVFKNPIARWLWKVLPGRAQKAHSNWPGSDAQT